MREAVSLETLPELTKNWCEQLGFKVNVRNQPSGDEELFPNRMVIEGADAQWLLTNRGLALDALQFLVHEAQGEREEVRLAYLDVQAVRLFRMKEVQAMAAMAAQKARQTGSYMFASLSPRERRWMHLTVAREDGLSTESEGTGIMKSLKVLKKN
jgi:predicted RNA-binding protein Jag